LSVQEVHEEFEETKGR